MDTSDTKLVAIVYPNMNTGKEVIEVLHNMQKKLLIDVADAAYITKDNKGKVEIHQTGHYVSGGAAGGAFWGFLIGALFLAPIFGLLVGVSTGALAGKMAQSGVNKQFIDDLKDKLKPGNSAVFVLVRSVTADKVIPELSSYGGYVMQTNLSKDAEERLQEELRKGELESVQHQMAAA
jgi:uncharacterized membrane protein